MFSELDREEVVGALDRAVEELLRAAGVEVPPVDAITLARRHLGMTVCLDKRQPQRGRATPKFDGEFSAKTATCIHAPYRLDLYKNSCS
jgi:hypothetical protein